MSQASEQKDVRYHVVYTNGEYGESSMSESRARAMAMTQDVFLCEQRATYRVSHLEKRTQTKTTTTENIMDIQLYAR